MYKEFKHNEKATYKDTYFSEPIDSHTLIRVEGLGDYTIISVGSIGCNVFALLENWIYGEEDMCIIYLSTLPVMWIAREDGKGFYSKYDKKLFVPRRYICVSSAYNDLKTELEDADILGINDEFVWWETSEIDAIIPKEVLDPTIKD